MTRIIVIAKTVEKRIKVLNHTNIIEALNYFGEEAYLVGGCVRDELLGFDVKDFDISTSASQETIKDLFGKDCKPLISRSGAPVSNVCGYEVATFRSETGTRHEAKFEPGTLLDDAYRRDFTVNALYKDLNGNILDPTHEGLKDIKDRKLRFIGTAQERLHEDPTRLLRAYRLSQTKRLKFSASTIFGCVKFVKEVGIGALAEEQIGRELRKIISQGSPEEIAQTLRLMRHDGLMNAGILRELGNCFGVEQGIYHREGCVFNHTMMVIEALERNADETIKWAAILHDIGKPPTRAEHELKGFTFYGHEEESARMAMHMLSGFNCFSISEINDIVFLVENHMRIHRLHEMKRKKQALLLRRPQAKNLLALGTADALGRDPQNTCSVVSMHEVASKFYAADVTLTSLGIDGKLLRSLGIPEGKDLGDKLRIMGNHLDSNPKLTKEQLLRYAGCFKSNSLEANQASVQPAEPE